LPISLLLLSAFICVHLRPTNASFAQATQPAGLAALSDEKLMNELAAHGLSALLDRAFEVNKIPPAEQDARRTMLALRQLTDGTSKLPRDQQQALVAKVVQGIDAALPNLKDPEAMMQQARALIDAAAARQLDTLELWGDNRAARQALKPVARTIVALYDRAATAAGQLVESIGNQPNPDDKRLEKMYNLQQLATFNARMSDYLLAAAQEPGDAQRATIADRGIAYLKELDVPEQPIRVAVRLRIGKLQLTRGDFAGAKASLAPIATDEAFKPSPTPIERYQANYFLVVMELTARNAKAAQAQLDELEHWQSRNLPIDVGTRASAEAASTMLQYRVHELSAQLAGNADDRRKANEAAVETLSQLLKDRPDLAGPINELLTARLTDDAPLTSLDPLLLQALVRRGEEQRLRPANEKIDEKLLRRGIAAAREIVSREPWGKVDPALLDNCRFVIPFLLQRAGDDQQSAGAFLDYAAVAGTTERGVIALDNAQAAVAALRKDRAEEENVRNLYDRFLPMAIEQFDRREFAFEYARRLQLLNQLDEAVRYFRLVPANDSRALSATFLQMLCEKQRLDALASTDGRRGVMLTEIQRLADVINQTAAKSNEPSALSILIRTKLLAAELARTEQKNPQRAIAMLADIEPALASLAGSDALLPEVLLVRVQSFMALGKSDEATAALVQLLAKRDGGQGAAIVYSLLQKLNEELESARAAGDADRVRTIARNRADLSGFLVKWARQSTDANISKFAYRYMVFDAASKQLAADSETDPAAQRSAREAALELYRSLQSAENVALYRGTLDARAGKTAGATAEYDPAVSVGIAILCFDLKQYAEARDRLARLLSDRKLGAAVVNTDDGTGIGPREMDNDQYWEAVLRFVQANAKLGEKPEENKNYLREQYIRWGDRVGGRKWRADFETLRRQLDVNVPTSKPAAE